MKTLNNHTMVKNMEMNDLFKVEIVDGKKRVSRWGFYADQGDGKYAVYRPEKPVCSVDELFMIDEDGPGAIDIVEENEIAEFLSEIGNELRGIPAAEVSAFTACGWYYDTIL